MAFPNAKVEVLFDAVETRRTIYSINNKCPVSDAFVQQIVEQAVKHGPSPFNVQATRCVLFLTSAHEQLWDMADAGMKTILPPDIYDTMAPRIAGFRRGHGTVAFFEDQDALKALGEAQPPIAGMLPQWSEHASGMAQFIVWTALSLEGVGCSMQHYNFNPMFTAEVKKTWELPESWDLKSQLVFGMPDKSGFERDRERTSLPIEGRVKVIGG